MPAQRHGNPPLDLTLFSSSWKDRCSLPAELAGARSVDRRVPVSAAQFRLASSGLAAGGTLATRRFDVTHSLHPLLLPSRGAAQVDHDSRSEFPDASGAHARRNPPRLSCARARPRPSRRPHHRAVASSPPAKSSGSSACPRIASRSVRRARQTGRRAIRRRPTATCCSSARWSRGRTSARCSTRTSGSLTRRRRRFPELVLAGKATEQSGRGSSGSPARRSPGRVRHIGYVDPGDRRRAVRRRAGCWCSRRSKKDSAFRCSRR